jgi:hypothetical protein
MKVSVMLNHVCQSTFYIRVDMPVPRGMSGIRAMGVVANGGAGFFGTWFVGDIIIGAHEGSPLVYKKGYS